MAAEDDAFRAAVLAQPLEHGPRLVWADALDERGDRRGPWLRHWFALEDAALAVPAGPAHPGWTGRQEARERYPGSPRLLAACLVAGTPLPGGGRLRGLLTDPRQARAVAVAGLAACGLAGPAEWDTTARAARAALVEAHAKRHTDGRLGLYLAGVAASLLGSAGPGPDDPPLRAGSARSLTLSLTLPPLEQSV